MNDAIFPIEKSLLSADALAKTIAAAYGFGDIRCQLLSSSMRDVYMVWEGEKRFIFYLYPNGQQTAAHIAAEWRFVDYLADNRFPVAAAIPTKDDQLLVRFQAPEGARRGVLAPFIPGEHFRRRPGGAAAAEVGRLTGKLHVLADELPFDLERPSRTLCEQLTEFAAAFAWAFPERKNDVATMEEAAAMFCRLTTNYPLKKPEYGLIHGDLIRANVQVGDNGQVTFLDFDLCAPGWRAYDLASFLFALKGMRTKESLSDAFLAGYEEVRPLTRFSRESLPVFHAARAVFTIGIPAMNIQRWGRARVEPWLEGSFARLKECLTAAGWASGRI